MNLKQLNRAKGQNRWCGPAIISFLSGISTDEAAQLIRHQTGRRMVTGTDTMEVRQALRALGYHMKTHFVPGLKRPTLAGWLRNSVEDRSAGRVFLVEAGHHWQLITGRRYACGRIGDIVSIKDKRVKRRAYVATVYEITEDNSVQKTRATRAHLLKLRQDVTKATATRSSKIRQLRVLPE